jgi:hypothetical protein
MDPDSGCGGHLTGNPNLLGKNTDGAGSSFVPPTEKGRIQAKFVRYVTHEVSVLFINTKSNT